MKFLHDRCPVGGEKMPLYEYRCYKCRSILEILQRLDDEPLKICPKCGGKLQKLISRSAIQFKGSGWYITDYARRQPNNGQSNQGNGSEQGQKERAVKKEKEPVDSSSTKPGSKE